MKLIIGLGNPGSKYAKTRHNIGFIVLDELAKSLGVSSYQEKFKGYFAEVFYGGEKVLLLKPQTFMNLSGQSVIEVVKYYKLSIDDILVIYDDLHLELGKIRFREKSSSGGHNGIKSMEDYLKTNEFKRLKFGIGRDARIPVVKYVVSEFSKSEIEVIKPQIITARDACIDYLSMDFLNLMSKYN